MEVTVHIPDDIAARLAQNGADLSRRALEGLALEEYKNGHLTKPELRKLLGLGRLALDGFLKSHHVFEDYTLEDFEEERRALQELGL
jgi:Uncharacterised protein family (UPF0175)